MGKIGQLLGNIKIKGDKPLWIIVLILTLFSIIIVYSSSYAETVSDGGSATKLLLEQVFFVVLGWTALIVCYYIPPYIYKKFSYFIFIFCCGLLLYAIIFGATKNGTSRWITIMHVSFQPSEFAKIGLVLYLASIIDRFDLDNFKTYVKTVLIPVGFMLFIILVNSVSMTVLLTLVAASLLLFNGLKGKYILRTLGIAAVLLGLAAGTVAIANNVFDKDIRIFQRFETAGARIE